MFSTTISLVEVSTSMLAAGQAMSRFRISNWALSIPVIAFTICFVIFIVMSIRALLMSDAKNNEMAGMPLQNNENFAPTKKDKDQNHE